MDSTGVIATVAVLTVWQLSVNQKLSSITATIMSLILCDVEKTQTLYPTASSVLLSVTGYREPVMTSHS